MYRCLRRSRHIHIYIYFRRLIHVLYTEDLIYLCLCPIIFRKIDPFPFPWISYSTQYICLFRQEEPYFKRNCLSRLNGTFEPVLLCLIWPKIHTYNSDKSIFITIYTLVAGIYIRSPLWLVRIHSFEIQDSSTSTLDTILSACR